MRTTPVPVTVGTFEMRGKHEGLKVMTVSRIAALGRQADALRAYAPKTINP